MKLLTTIVIIVYCSIVYGIDLPPGLRPAKAVGEAEKPIVPGRVSENLEVIFL